jgi:hypothetical protein
MTKQKIFFFIIVGAAVIFVGLMIALNPVLVRLLEPPDLDATATVMSIRATDVSLKATEVAIAASQAAIEGRSVAEESLSRETGQVSPNPVTPVQSGAESLTWEGLQIDIMTIYNDAWPLVKTQNQYNDPPLSGRRMLMITVKVTDVEGPGDEYLRLDASDFRLIGSRNEVYTTWGDETSCGVVPDELDGVVAQGIFLEGNICFQVPLDENNFQLIYEQQVADYPAVYISLPE